MTRLSSLFLTGAMVVFGSTAHAKTESNVETDAASLTVIVENLSQAEGTVRLGLFDKEGFQSGQAVHGAAIKVTGDTVTTTLEDLPVGRYAIRLFHDVNDNKEMDTNPFGMPIEPYGFSNNARGQFGPATWEDSAFDISEAGTTHIITIAGE